MKDCLLRTAEKELDFIRIDDMRFTYDNAMSYLRRQGFNLIESRSYIDNLDYEKEQPHHWIYERDYPDSSALYRECVRMYNLGCRVFVQGYSAIQTKEFEPCSKI